MKYVYESFVVLFIKDSACNHPFGGGGRHPGGEAPPKSGTVFSFQVYGVGKSVIWVFKKAQKGWQMHFMGCEKVKKKNLLDVWFIH